jgi:hypothetical protein
VVEVRKLERRRTCDGAKREESVACSLARRRPIQEMKKPAAIAGAGFKPFAMMPLCR